MKLLIIFLMLLYSTALFAQDFWEPLGLQGKSIRAIAINNNGDIFAGSIDAIYSSIDHGNTWNSSFIDALVFCMAINSNDDIFAGAEIPGILRSTDYGNTWEHLDFVDPYGYSIGINPVNNDIFVGTAGTLGLQGIFYSSDNGDNWIPLKNFPLTGAFRDIAVNSTGDIVLCSAGAKGKLFKSTDNGNSWTGVGAEFEYVPKQIKLHKTDSTENVYVAVSSNVLHRIYFSTDYGENWTAITNDGFTGTGISAFEITHEGDIFASILNTGVFLLKNNADYWIPVNEGLIAESVYEFAICPQGYIYAATDNGIFKSTEPVTDGQVYAGNYNFYGFNISNFPNPFSEKTTITYTVPAGYHDNIIISVYDLNGNLVNEIVNKNHTGGNYTITFDASHLKPGVYFYNIRAENFNETKKMVLIK